MELPENGVESGQWSGRARKSGKVECEGLATLRGEKMEVGPGQGWWEVRRVSSGGRRSRWGSQGSSPGLLRQNPSQQPSADNQGVHGSLEPRDRAVMHVQENWCLEKGRSQESVRTGRRSSLDGHEPVFLLKRRILGGDSAGAPREEEGTQGSRDRGELVRGKFRRTGGPRSLWR